MSPTCVRKSWVCLLDLSLLPCSLALDNTRVLYRDLPKDNLFIILRPHQTDRIIAAMVHMDSLDQFLVLQSDPHRSATLALADLLGLTVYLMRKASIGRPHETREFVEYGGPQRTRLWESEGLIDTDVDYESDEEDEGMSTTSWEGVSSGRKGSEK